MSFHDAIQHAQTKPLVDYYMKQEASGAPRYAGVNGMGAVEEIRDRLISVLGRK